jgi:osmotically-inducible protein OsmY
VAKGVRGVKGIENNIAVDYTTGRSDAEIRAEIKKTLRWDAYVDDALINVSVDDGNVSLAGIVGSMAEKSRARADAWVVGEDEFFWSPFVDGDDITVQVDDGVAELTGTVDTWSERESAEENARQGGAVIVDNDLLVLYGPEYYKK